MSRQEQLVLDAGTDFHTSLSYNNISDQKSWIRASSSLLAAAIHAVSAHAAAAASAAAVAAPAVAAPAVAVPAAPVLFAFETVQDFAGLAIQAAHAAPEPQ